MMRRFLIHSKSVWPQAGMVALFVVAYGMLDAGLWIIERPAGNLSGAISTTPEIQGIRSAILGIAAGLYAFCRLYFFHPACSPPYAAWLKSSPWTPGKALPLGPVHPVWQDAVVIGALAALAKWHAHVSWTLPLVAFGLTYLIVMTLLLAVTRTWASSLLLGFLWPALFLPAVKGPPTVAIFAVLIIVIWHGHRKSMRAFPWWRKGSGPVTATPAERANSLLERQVRVNVFSPPGTAQNPGAGWPFQRLSPKIGGTAVAPMTAIALSVLFGWWCYCDIVALDLPPCPELLLLFAIVAGLVRWVIYCSGLGPSFNLWGRLASGRIIVPGFDQVFVTPLMVIVVAIVGGVIIRHAGTWYPAVTACVFAAIWLVLLSGGPTLRKWILTGHHRFRRPAYNRNAQLLRPTGNTVGT